MVVMAAVFSTYLYLGRNLTRLSFRNVMEGQSRNILRTLTIDIQNTKSLISATNTGLALTVDNQNPLNGPVPTMKVVYAYDGSTNKLIRRTSQLDDSGPVTATLNHDIGDNNVQVPVAMLNFNFLYYITTGGSPVSQFNSTIVPISIKQVAISFTLQAGDPAIQGQQGTLSSYPVASGRMPLLNRQFLDGS